MATPKERYDARQKLKKLARDPDEPSDQKVEQDYVLDLLERFVTAVEGIEINMRHSAGGRDDR